MNHPSTSEPSRPVTARGQRTRQQLLDAAETVFGAKGIEHAAIADITRSAGVALGTFYVYFPSKHALFLELVDELGNRLRRSIAEKVAGLTDRLEIEREGFRAFFEFAATHRNLYKIIRQAEFVDEAAYRAYYERLAKSYAHGLSAAMATGQIRKCDPDVLAYSLMGIADFVGMRWVLWETEAELNKILDQVIAFVESGLSPSAKPNGTRPKKRR